MREFVWLVVGERQQRALIDKPSASFAAGWLRCGTLRPSTSAMTSWENGSVNPVASACPTTRSRVRRPTLMMCSLYIRHAKKRAGERAGRQGCQSDRLDRIAGLVLMFGYGLLDCIMFG